MASEKSEGVFANALKRLTSREVTTHSRGVLPGAIRVRGAAYPPISAPAVHYANAPGGTPAVLGDMPVLVATSPPSMSSTAAVSSGISTDPTTPTILSTRASPSPVSPDPVMGTAAGAGDDADVYDREKDPVRTCRIRGSVRIKGKEWDKESSTIRMAKFQKCLDARLVEMEVLRELAWSGVPSCFRICTWQTLLGYLPTNKDRQTTSISKKKLEYQQCIAQYFGSRGPKSETEQTLLRQVLVDVPRTFPDIPLFRSEFVQRSLERVLYVWALRHPASGYVQGINDLATPFYAVFLSPWTDIDSKDISHIDAETLADVEADVYWCLTKLLDGIQDHYTPSQPGIQRMTFRLRELVHRIDESLVMHLENNGVEFHQLAFRWMNCLLMRELPFNLIIRVWDTCLAEKDGFDAFHVYVCAALVLRFSATLKAMKFQELVTFIQKMPTKEWKIKDVEELLAQAYVYKASFEAAPSHLT